MGCWMMRSHVLIMRINITLDDEDSVFLNTKGSLVPNDDDSMNLGVPWKNPLDRCPLHNDVHVKS